MALERGTVLGKKWVIGDLVGQGACGRVYAVSPNGNNAASSYPSSSSSNSAHQWVSKVIALPEGKGKAAKEQERLCNTLFYEYTLFHSQLSSFAFRPAIPDVLNFHGVDDVLRVRYMVMQRFERDLVGLARSASKPTVAQVATIGIQLIDGLEWLHQKGLLFIDVKPDNFMLNGDQRVFFVDYGLVERWGSAMGGVKPDQPREMVGTPTFASIDVHSGHTPQRKDDMESCALVLVSLFSDGNLPWSTSTSDGELQTAKRNCDMKALTQSLNCPELGTMVAQTRVLQYDAKPNYDGYRQLLAAMRDRKVTAVGAAAGAAAGAKRAGGNSSRAHAVVVVDIEEADAGEDENKKKAKGGAAARGSKKAASKQAAEEPATPLLPRDDDDEVVLVSYVSRGATSKGARVASTAPTRKSARLSFDNPSRSRTSDAGYAQALYMEALVGPHKGETYTLGSTADKKSGQLQQKVIGRSDGSDVVLDRDDFVSEKHLTMLWQWDEAGQLDLNVQDRQSSNGTQLNGTRLATSTWQLVKSGDVLLLGTTELKVVCSGDSKEDEKGAKKSKGKK